MRIPARGLGNRRAQAMNDFSAIDGFLDTFIRYIDSGFGLVAGDVTSLAAILIVIDVTLAALFWAWGQNTDIIQSLIKKTLYVGAFAFIMGNFAMLSNVIFESFARLGLQASAAGFGAGDLLRPGLVAAEGMAASAPIFDLRGQILERRRQIVRPHIVRRVHMRVRIHDQRVDLSDAGPPRVRGLHFHHTGRQSLLGHDNLSLALA